MDVCPICDACTCGTSTLADWAVYIDLDGVLADYSAGIRKLGYNIDLATSKTLNRSGSKSPLKREMYERIKGTNFYRDLPLMPHAAMLWAELAKANPIILTAAPKFGASEDDYFLNPFWLGAAYRKRQWVEEQLLPEVLWRTEKRFESEIYIPDDRFICTTSARKMEFMHRKKSSHQILIDDREANCVAWAAAGGFAVLYNGNVFDAFKYLRQYQWEGESMRKTFVPCGGGMVAGLPNALGTDITFIVVGCDISETTQIPLC